MTATQTQIRGDTATAMDLVVLAARELGIDTTNWRLRVGDGSTQGGLIVPLATDLQKQSFTAATAGGTADALTLALDPVPAAWTTNMTLSFKAASNNTGSATIAITGLTGTKTLKKIVSGSITDLEADDIVQDGCYIGIYNGTDVIIVGGITGGGLQSVSQDDINTSTGTFSDSFSNPYWSGSTQVLFIQTTGISLPGGQYSLGIQSDCNNATVGGFWYGTDNNSYSSEAVAWFINSSTGGSETIQGRQRYITSSPPFDLGDGAAGGFIFLKLDKQGNVKRSYAADVPPWGYNGPTDIRGKECPVTGKKFRKVIKKRSLEEFMDGASIEYEYQEITQAIKNADMGLLPHPFGRVSPDETVVMLDPMDERLAKLIKLQNEDPEYDLSHILHSGKIYTEDEPMKRKGPQGVKITPLRYKYSAR